MAKKPVKTRGPETPQEIQADHKPDTVQRIPQAPPHGPALPVDSLWKPGVSANPGGAPKGKRISTWLAEFQNMSEDEWPTPDQLRRMPVAACIAMAQLRRAMDELDGLPAAAWAADRVEGGVDRTVHLTHKQEPTMSAEDAAKIIKDAGLDGSGGQLEKF